MNFYEHQDQARRSTRRLVLLFILAVVTLILLTTALVYGVFFYADSQTDSMLTQEVLLSEVFLTVSLGVSAVVGLAILFRMMQLRGGGEAVAESLGGRVLNTGTRGPDERKVLNVVEEMAIAAGVPVPPVYLLEDEAINAFAAGYKPQDAVIGVTRGCITQLNRDELQGVVAHEFSHIIHGDMRLNLRLIGVLYGIMVLGLIGFHVLRGGVYGSVASSRSRGRRQGGAFLALGLGLIVIGYGGTLFGKLIRSAVSRQREFLADASAVQFTRNPDGIAGALSKIGGYGSRLYSVDAGEISHMLIGEGGKPSFSGLFSTHPPIEERIRRIHPGWEGGRPEGGDESGQETPRSQGSSAAGGTAGFASAAGIADSVGNPDAGHLAAAGRELAMIPAQLSEALHDPYAVRGVMLALVMAASPAASREQQMAGLQQMLAEDELADLLEREQQVGSLSDVNHLTLVELAMPALKQLSPAQQKHFRQEMMRLIAADQQVTLFEWCLYRLVDAGFQTEKPRRQRESRKLSALGQEVERLLSVLACAGQADTAARERAFNAAREELGMDSLTLHDGEQLDIRALDTAVTRLMQLHPLQKPRLLKAMVQCCMADGRLRRQEGELLRAVASLLDCPLPPLQQQAE